MLVFVLIDLTIYLVAVTSMGKKKKIEKRMKAALQHNLISSELSNKKIKEAKLLPSQ